MTDAPSLPASGIDPDDLATTLRVLASLDEVDQQHPDYLAVRRATANMFKAVKRARRKEIRDAIAEADKAVVARTATGAPDRIDDETRGLDLASSVVDAPIAGELLKPRNCYICKQPYTIVDAFYHQLCPDCAPASATASATPAPTSQADVRCSPGDGRRSACTSRCVCCAMAPT